jgi:hypothetical protein
MAFLGALVVWVPLLALSLTVAVCAVAHAWQTWQRVKRARRAAWWAAQQPYDRAQVRAFEAYAWERGERDALAELEDL